MSTKLFVNMLVTSNSMHDRFSHNIFLLFLGISIIFFIIKKINIILCLGKINGRDV
ncbi:hypothetical protein CNO14_06755 [Borrelia miyamotoi]|uniref:Uncharacterized protein n=1 Tax=Borrelia miyamotoi TaxID=47466 RepID=A0AAQ3HFN8_9SPIR|nr:hypothetical protein [Borrelia miyamotoi]WAZ70847.1 hypothetical protein O5403_04300 [Borrelia miyamotoi]WCB91003.1 hypothetical protein CNO11_07125 [Borrelia miyamotoi]WDE71640.1 hypothetical protein CNO13_06535 [Borrelia miyamotoi]WDE73113.1 hypothetical protein CNO14_06755 [Borrelia miyamotoi]WDS49018.1 hypothetical protein EZU71_07615 [Borrelia miyamotoi]